MPCSSKWKSSLYTTIISRFHTRCSGISHSHLLHMMKLGAVCQRKDTVSFSPLEAKKNFKGSLFLISCFGFHLDMLTSPWKMYHWGFWMPRRKTCLCNHGMIQIPPMVWIPPCFISQLIAQVTGVFSRGSPHYGCRKTRQAIAITLTQCMGSDLSKGESEPVVESGLNPWPSHSVALVFTIAHHMQLPNHICSFDIQLPSALRGLMWSLPNWMLSLKTVTMSNKFTVPPKLSTWNK